MTPEYNPIHNFKQVSKNIAIGGQLNQVQYSILHDWGYEAIIQINVQDDQFGQANEAFFARINHLDYSAMELSFASLNQDTYEEFAELMALHEGKKVYVHCTAGFYASLLMVIYQMLEHDLKLDAAIERYAIDKWIRKSQWLFFIERTVASYRRQQRLVASA